MGYGIMEVVLVNAKGLGGTDFFGKIDPYVVIKYKSQERKSTVAREGGGSPSWNEKFRFRVEYPGSAGAAQQYKLIFTIMDHDNFSSDDFIGQATIYVEDLLALGAENGSSELNPTKYRVVRADGTYTGEIQVGVTFTLQMKTQDEEVEYGGWKQSDY